MERLNDMMERVKDRLWVRIVCNQLFAASEHCLLRRMDEDVSLNHCLQSGQILCSSV